MHRLNGRGSAGPGSGVGLDKGEEGPGGGGGVEKTGSRELQHLATDCKDRKGEEAMVTLRLSLG